MHRPEDYTAVLDKDGLKGARVGLPSDPADPANDVYYGELSPRSARVMSGVVETLRAAGAEIVRANIPTVGWIGGPGTEMAVPTATLRAGRNMSWRTARSCSSMR